MKSIKVVSFYNLNNFIFVHFFAWGFRLASTGQNEVKKYCWPFLASRGQTEAPSQKMRKYKNVQLIKTNNFDTIHFFARGVQFASRGQKEVKNY